LNNLFNRNERLEVVRRYIWEERIMRHKSLTTILAAAVMAVGLFAGSAMAAYPTSIAGTWTAQANESPWTIEIQQASTTGVWKQITGTLGSFPLVVTGRFDFVVNEPSSDVAVQEYSGNVSNTGSTIFMSGIFGTVIPVQGQGFPGGAIGEYNFSAYQVVP
jgi:predicted secreted protein